MPLSSQALDALTAFRSEVGAIHKGATANAGSYSYNYVEINALLDAIEEPLKSHGFTITQVLNAIDGKPSLATVLWHEDKDGNTSSLGGEVTLVHAPNDPQAFGASLTYHRRYAIITILGLRTEDNDAAPKVRPAPSTQQPSAPSRSSAPSSGGKKPPNFQGMLYFRAKEAGFDSDKLAQEKFGVDSSKKLTDDQAKELLDWLKNGAVDAAEAIIQEQF